MAMFVTRFELAAATRIPEADLDAAAAALVLDLTNGLVTEVLGVLAVPGATSRSIAIEAARRAYDNPNGWSMESVDDFRGQRPESAAAAGVYLTDAERSKLVASVTAGAVVLGARSVRIAHGFAGP